jgi:general stress protein 26
MPRHTAERDISPQNLVHSAQSLAKLGEALRTSSAGGLRACALHWFERMGQAKQDDSAIAEHKFFELLRKFDNAMLVTHAGDGAPLHARPMQIAETSEDGSIWFIAAANSPKIDELTRDSHILAILQNEKQWVSVSGRAELHHDRARIHKVWKEQFRAWFDGKDDPNIVLIRLNPTDAEYWDNKGIAGLKLLVKATAAYVTGKELNGPNDVRTHAKVPL